MNSTKFYNTFLKKHLINIRDDTNDDHKNCQLFNIPPPLSIYVQNSSISLTLNIQFQMNPPPILHPWIIYHNLRVTIVMLLSGPFFRFLNFFQHQLITLVWLSFAFSFSGRLTICFFVALYSCVWQLSKNITKVF